MLLFRYQKMIPILREKLLFHLGKYEVYFGALNVLINVTYWTLMMIS